MTIPWIEPLVVVPPAKPPFYWTFLLAGGDQGILTGGAAGIASGVPEFLSLQPSLKGTP
jgi:hypothetical protein